MGVWQAASYPLPAPVRVRKRDEGHVFQGQSSRAPGKGALGKSAWHPSLELTLDKLAPRVPWAGP